MTNTQGKIWLVAITIFCIAFWLFIGAMTAVKLGE